MRRNGIALLITIAFVTAIMALIAIAGTILSEGFKRGTEKAFLVQSNILLPDIYSVLKENSRDINSSDTLDIFLSLPLLLENKDNGTMIDLSFVSDASKVNINHLLPAETNTSLQRVYVPAPLNASIEAYLDNILIAYNVSDAPLLISMIADTIDMDTQERSTGSEIALESSDFSQGKVYDMHHFRQILNAYKRKTQDFSVDDIPWQRLIGFRNDVIDFNHIEPEVLHYIDPIIDSDTVKQLTTQKSELFTGMETLPLPPETQKRLEEMNVAFYAPNVIAKMNVFNATQKVSYTFAYDLSNQKASDFAVSN